MKALQVLLVGMSILAGGCMSYAGYDEWAMGSGSVRAAEAEAFAQVAASYPTLLSFSSPADAQGLTPLDAGSTANVGVSDGSYRYSARGLSEFERVAVMPDPRLAGIAICLTSRSDSAGFVEVYATEQLTVALHDHEGGAGAGLHLLEFVQDGETTVLRVDGVTRAREVHDLAGLTLYFFGRGSADVDWIAYRLE